MCEALSAALTIYLILFVIYTAGYFAEMAGSDSYAGHRHESLICLAYAVGAAIFWPFTFVFACYDLFKDGRK